MDLARSPVAEVEATVLLPYVLSQFVVGGRRSLPVDSGTTGGKIGLFCKSFLSRPSFF